MLLSKYLKNAVRFSTGQVSGKQAPIFNVTLSIGINGFYK